MGSPWVLEYPYCHQMMGDVLYSGLQSCLLYNCRIFLTSLRRRACCCMLQHQPGILGCKGMKNVGVRAAREQEPQHWGANMGIFMLVPWVWELLGHLDLVLQWRVLWAFPRGVI